MATVDQDTRRLQRELRDQWRIGNYFEQELVLRQSDSSFWGTGVEGIQIKNYYGVMRIYLELFQEQYREVYRRCRKWSRDYAAIPDVFENPLGAQVIEIKRPMATNNRLTNAQIDASTTVEPFLTTGNRYENLWDVLDCFIDFLTVFELRIKGWSNQWDARGSQPRFNRIVSILEDLTAIARAGSSLLEDIAEQVNKDKAAGIDELELRQNYSQRRNALGGGVIGVNEGGLYALNRGLTTVELGGTTEPEEYNPDIESVRDFPDLGTDVV